LEHRRDCPTGARVTLGLKYGDGSLLTKENIYRQRSGPENTNMILALAAAIYGYFHLASCHRAEASYRAAVDQRLKLVCG